MAFAGNNRDFNDAVQHHQRGDLRQAERLYRKAIKKNPGLTEAYQNLGVVLIDQQRATEGIRALERGLEMDPRHAGLLSTLSSAFMNLGQMEAGKKHAQALVTYHPEKSEAYFNLALFHASNQEFLQALKLYDKAIELNLAYGHAHYNKGLSHYQLRELEKARKSFEACLRIEPSLNAARINLGRVLAEEGSYDDAIKVLGEALEKEPNHGNTHQQMGMVMHLISDMAKAELHLKKALELGPENGELHTLLGNVYRDLGDEKKGLKHYELALKLDPENELAQRNIDFFNGNKVARWHFDMLADGGRNRAYHKAIKSVVKDSDVVFDIGAGAGLLSLMAAKAGAKEVLAIELMDIIADAAQDVVKENEYEETIKVLRKRSTSMVEGRDFKEKADVVVSEILDAGLLGEGVLPTLRHAAVHLLKPEGQMIPKAATINCMAVQMDDLKAVYPIQELEGFNLSAFARFSSKNEYRGVDLRVQPHLKLSEPQSAKTFDFKHPGAITSEKEPGRLTIDMNITSDGSLQGVAFWFDLHLTDDIVASSGPEGEMIHWRQAVFFIETPINVKKGDTVEVEFCHSETRVWFEVKSNS